MKPSDIIAQMHPAQRAFYESEPRPTRPYVLVRRCHGWSQYRAIVEEIRRGGR